MYRPLHLMSELSSTAYLDLFDAQNRMVPSISPYLYWFSSHRQKRFPISKIEISIRRPLHLLSELPSRVYVDLSDARDCMVPSISPYLYSFSSHRQKRSQYRKLKSPSSDPF